VHDVLDVLDVLDILDIVDLHPGGKIKKCAVLASTSSAVELHRGLGLAHPPDTINTG
jgi:hypothetical protein